MHTKNLKWSVFSGFLVLLLTVAGVLVLSAPAGVAYSATGVAQAQGQTKLAPDGVSCTSYTEIEPNSTITDSQQITLTGPTTVDGAITPAGDQDYFKFAINSGANFWGYVVTNQSAPSTDSILTLMNASGTTVQLDDDNGFQSTLSSAIAGAPITATGTHLVQVRQFGGATVMSQYFLYMDVTTGPPTEETEANDTLGTADAYTVGQVISGSIPITTDLDLYSFSLAAGDKIVIQVDGDPDRNGTNLSRVNQFNPSFDLLDGAGALITTVDSDSQGGNGGLLSENLVYTATASTNFFVQVRADASTPVEDDTGQYRLHMYKVNCPAGPNTATPTPTGTVIPPTGTPTATSTGTVIPPTATPDPTAVPPTATQTSTSAPTSTGTVVPATSTNTSVAATNTSTVVASSTVVGATSTPMATATVCTVNFPDNQPGDTFYEYIQCLACRGIVTGYPDGMFHAERNITRGQISKMVSNAAGFNEDPGPQIYQDV
ncbi:MAG TPA: S-layer homology domain-containing protein, partial [Chloroflexia bacterium]